MHYESAADLPDRDLQRAAGRRPRPMSQIYKNTYYGFALTGLGLTLG